MFKNLQFITHSDDPEVQLEQVRKACESGVEWIQVRIKAHSKEEIKDLAKEARIITSKFGVMLCINDHLDVALQCKADACHLGKGDMPIASAKALTEGNKVLIGATCNTIEDVYAAYKAGADYIGLGPYRFTTTKEKLSPQLGIDGYKSIIDQMAAKNITTPIVAIGGIEVEDVKPILITGVQGIAISNAIINAENWKEQVAFFQNELTTTKEKSNVANS
jgi:thiamine-phosphate pyrophosphorylase